MNVIDKILNEWSFRCHDGIVDMNNTKKVSILKEVLIEEGIDDDIVDAVLNLPKDDQASEEKKQKALAVLTGTSSDEKDKEIEQIKDEVSPKDFKTIYNRVIPYLEKDKGLPNKETLALISTFVLKDEEEDLINYYKANHKFNINSDESILNVPIKGGLKEDTVEDIYKMFSGGAGGGKGVGKEEYFLVAFYNNVKKEKQKGDLIIDGEKYEVKGNESIVAPSDYSRGKRTSIDPILTSLINKIAVNFKDIYTKNISGIQKIIKPGTKWVSSVANLGNTYFSDNIDNIEKYLKILEQALRKVYENITLDNNILTGKKIDDNKLAIRIAHYLIDNYKLNAKEKFMFVSDNEEIKIVPTKEILKDLINNGINIVAFSDSVPRLTYKGINTFAEKILAPEKAQKAAKEIETEIDQEIAEETEVKELKQKFDQAEAKLEDKKKEEPNRQFKFLEDELEKAKVEYNDYVKKRKEELSRIRKNLTEELTNYLIESFK